MKLIDSVIFGSDLSDDISYEDSSSYERRAFLEGFLYALDSVATVYANGYLRPAEIESIIRNFAMNEISRWAAGGCDCPAPSINIEKWPSIKNKVYQKYGGICASCSSDNDLNIHHIESVSDGGLPNIDNLILLCSECHKKEHSVRK